MTPLDGTPVLTAAQMRDAEEATGVSVEDLMHRAGTGIATALRRLAAGREVLILCGPGNNGGDGYVAANLLAAAGLSVRVAALAEPRSAAAIKARDGWGGAVEDVADAAPAAILVDALFGTGLSRPLDDAIANRLHELQATAQFSIAVDLPSGLATDDGAVLTRPPAFDVTLALGAAKPSHLLQPAARYCGAVRLLDIGLGAAGQERVLAAPALRDPGPDSHKYTRGLVAIVPGAMPGAAELASIAALRSGAGYVLLLTDAPGSPHAIVRRAWRDDALDDARIGAVLIGPGLGRDAQAQHRLDTALATPHRFVIDGDALHLVTPDRLATLKELAILTPHSGEFDALFGTSDISKIDRTRRAAARANAIVVHKGADTVIAAPDGRVAIAAHASDWLSTAGTGDVLAGAIAAMRAGLPDAFEAACAGVWLHADAARRCDKAFIADDLAVALTAARGAL
ncbi:NAD(P)H-hydrate dehydratase [Sphingomonas oligophenolica]|uniref:Bifunctional NAD(P)H-hydrate repair enzyme n=1 Tax=Sphingomonas oligophenolica TaxID=301154 RepID=A0A502CPH1_9SPHN|nr:NAD(P)H-hydrate dehydratase [Sphingomonas oligophenolica]TPG14430.1 NAD(P)H-hydrate dehydratase [Sphingomonas oligophenolica]